MSNKTYIKYVNCADCGRKIPIGNAHMLNSQYYGSSCYHKRLLVLFKQWEDEKNREYSIKCFAVMQIFQGKKRNNFHDSICKQWNECKKLTAKQLECIIKGFTEKETIDFWLIWQPLTNDQEVKEYIAEWLEIYIIRYFTFANYLENEEVINCLKYNPMYRNGFHFCRGVEEDDDPDNIWIMRNGRRNQILNENLEDDEIEVIKIVEGCQQ